MITFIYIKWFKLVQWTFPHTKPKPYIFRITNLKKKKIQYLNIYDKRQTKQTHKKNPFRQWHQTHIYSSSRVAFAYTTEFYPIHYQFNLYPKKKYEKNEIKYNIKLNWIGFHLIFWSLGLSQYTNGEYTHVFPGLRIWGGTTMYNQINNQYFIYYHQNLQHTEINSTE